MSNLNQADLVESFINAVNIEQKSDILLTNEYLDSYSPKKLAQSGLAIINLIINNIKLGLGGKTLIELVIDPAIKGDSKDELSVGSLRVGDIVKLDKQAKSTASKDKVKEKAKEDESLEGVIIRQNSYSITISIDDDSTDDKVLSLYNNTSNDNTRMWLVKLSNSVTYKRMLSTLRKLGELKDHQKSYLIRLLLGEAEFSSNSSSSKISEFFNPTLNDSQKEAVKFAVDESPITIIHGPPGTGKTSVILEIIKQLTFVKGERILVCGPSNISVDTILERLSSQFGGNGVGGAVKSPDKLIRLGHPARLLETNLRHSLDILSKTNYSGSNNNKDILKDIEKDINDTLKKIKKCKRYSERRVLYSELKQFKKELRVREKKIVQDLLINANVILSTLHGAGSYELTNLYKEEFSDGKPFFDTIIIDEVSQSLEPQCWIPIINHIGFKRLVIAGDNLQLPPTLKSKDEIERLLGNLSINKVANLEFTLFDRLVKKLEGNKFKKLLDTQYRMNQLIMKFPSHELYQDKLKAFKAVENISLLDVKGVTETDETKPICIWYDTQGGDFPEKSSDEDTIIGDSTGSKYNEMESLVVIQHVKKLLACGVSPNYIGIISPYSAQVSLLKKSFQKEQDDSRFAYNEIEISTVDGFQGREKEIIIISLVRSNDAREVGFLKDKRRLNVAMTRPKRQLCVVGDLELMSQCGIKYLHNWAQFVENAKDSNDDSVYEIIYPDLGDY
ncbi:P-loop containing nucleoside triphosphate hydrolase protein [Scheffersomyces coipomensis]|uniref:P-loop containing nucleoside triphosphate hydrolase protein n=1 Tax=Scheffersomyces coipomensis TaxID=1788519 RepID=UPI00315CB609